MWHKKVIYFISIFAVMGVLIKYPNTLNNYRIIGISLETENTTNLGLSYSIKDDDTITITKYVGSTSKIEIPSTIDGLPVTSIGYQAFYECNNLESIVIPDSVTLIEDLAFCSCTSLKILLYQKI